MLPTAPPNRPQGLNTANSLIEDLIRKYKKKQQDKTTQTSSQLSMFTTLLPSLIGLSHFSSLACFLLALSFVLTPQNLSISHQPINPCHVRPAVDIPLQCCASASSNTTNFLCHSQQPHDKLSLSLDSLFSLIIALSSSSSTYSFFLILTLPHQTSPHIIHQPSVQPAVFDVFTPTDPPEKTLQVLPFFLSILLRAGVVLLLLFHSLSPVKTSSSTTNPANKCKHSAQHPSTSRDITVTSPCCSPSVPFFNNKTNNNQHNNKQQPTNKAGTENNLLLDCETLHL